MRRELATLVGIALLLSSSAAVAEPGQVVLVGGQVVTGDLQKVVKGDYIIIVLPNGDVKAIAWADIQSFGFAGGGAAEATAPPAPVYVGTPFVPYYVPPPPPPPRVRFVPAWTIGARVGTMAVGGHVYGGDDYYYAHDHDHSDVGEGPRLRMDDIASWGWMVEGDLGYHFSPAWSVYGFWEHGELGNGDLNVGSRAHTNAVGVGVRATTTPLDVFGFYFDAGASYRWMDFSNPSVGGAGSGTRANVEGIDFLRLSLGVSI